MKRIRTLHKKRKSRVNPRKREIAPFDESANLFLHRTEPELLHFARRIHEVNSSNRSPRLKRRLIRLIENQRVKANDLVIRNRIADMFKDVSENSSELLDTRRPFFTDRERGGANPLFGGPRGRYVPGIISRLMAEMTRTKPAGSLADQSGE